MWERRAYLLGVVALSALLSGCVAIFLHDTLPATITITEQETRHPLASVPVSVGYTYDGYQYLYVFNRPENAEGTTDANGQLVLPVADFEYGAVFKAAYARVQLSPEQVRTGGSFTMLNMGTLNAEKPTLILGLQRQSE